MNDNAYQRCQWCYGKGCLACASERERHMKEDIEPLFVAKSDNKHDFELLSSFFGKKALERAFLDERGNGMQEIMVNATLARMLQEMHKENRNVQEIKREEII